MSYYPITHEVLVLRRATYAGNGPGPSTAELKNKVERRPVTRPFAVVSRPGAGPVAGSARGDDEPRHQPWRSSWRLSEHLVANGMLTLV